MTHLSGPTSKFGLLLLVVPFLLSIPKERQRQLITGRTPTVNIHREYYMAARRYEISLRVFQHKKFRTIFLKWLFLAVKGLFYCVATATVIFSRVNTLTVVTCIFKCEDIMISCESSNGISLVFIFGLQARDMLVINTINNFFYGFYMKMELRVHFQRKEALLFLITNMAAVTSSANRHCTSI